MSQQSKSVLPRALDPAFLLGAVATVAFYWVMHQPAMHETIVYRYATEHVAQYAIVSLFIWGLADVLLKLLSFPREVLALRQQWLPSRNGLEPVAAAQVLLDRVRTFPGWLQDSRVGRRITRALEFLTEKGSADGYREHLQYLAEQDDDATHANYSLIRFVAGVSPVLGFLGTVVHFGTALSGISYNEMAERLPGIVAEMGAAFNTTAVALAAAMTMLFALFVCERFERGIVRSVDRLVDRELLNRFESRDPEILPVLSAVQSAGEESLRAIAAVVQGQLETWTRGLEALFQRFDQRQQQESQGWHGVLDILQQRHEAYDAAHQQRLQQSVSLIEAGHEKHLAQIQTTLERAVLLREDLAAFAKTLDTIARGEGRLAELQAILTDNLRVLHETKQIDDALHGLTAAIHLLTARHRQAAA